MHRCQLCRRHTALQWLNFGPQPICNRFLRTSDEPFPFYPLAVGYCPDCGGVQLAQPMPVEELRPRFDWITYSEPESHLEELADLLRALPGITPAATVGGLSSADEPCLRRLRARGLLRTWVAEKTTDLGIHEPRAGTESIQQVLTATTAARLVERHGRADVLVVRYLLEHAHDLARLLDSLHRLIVPGGYLAVEVPDARRALAGCDYSTVWEEHTIYFTPATLRQALTRAGFEVVFLGSFPYPLDDAVVAIARPMAPRPATLPPDALHEETARAARFVRQFASQRGRYWRYFEQFRRTQGRIAFLGAGHLSCAMINYFRLAPLIDMVIDDQPHKQGMFMAGSRLPIHSAVALLEQNVKLCCMSVRPEIEARVRQKNQTFLDRGGILASIFPASPSALVVGASA
jgi:hypothetical protein